MCRKFLLKSCVLCKFIHVTFTVGFWIFLDQAALKNISFTRKRVWLFVQNCEQEILLVSYHVQQPWWRSAF